ncbi:Isoprenylcysteine carboxyl methyltransferase (ICMT) family protein [Paraburkholderia piptadeniae]|uniref:Isoprenylcysteine carboxyl methyltransferase (ICMT) family protein n=1 Tax=Paraburkholderia piptadeniae TaxID=1701573 RepID=A0A1N7SS49_9BURK|nr:isoprenylcysteine carboxylmethyltransferase family protein [Paraburkholderia piptadeniae]SIT50186.1 Isoprenylcysteine carboxyl methyltransferase (ICMT) family protein [Paraburkholderia piptadeniae]
MGTIIDQEGTPAAQQEPCLSEVGAPASPRVGDVLLEVMSRVCAALMLSIFSYMAILHWRADPGRITLLLLVVTECFTVGLSLFARVPVRRDWSPFAWFCSMGATYYFLAVQLAPGVRLVPESVGGALQVAGICWQIFAKASLRRSFGLLPANRGVISTGAYRFIRHPMYLGYFIADMGFLLTTFGLQNVLVYGFQFALQGVRIMREEQLLSSDESYRRYKGKVRFRIIPRVF